MKPKNKKKITTNRECSHIGLELYDEYFNLYYCRGCCNYFIPTREWKHKVQFSIAYVMFSRNDDRIVNVWCPDLMELRKKYMRSKEYKKHLEQQNKLAIRMYGKK